MISAANIASIVMIQKQLYASAESAARSIMTMEPSAGTTATAGLTAAHN